MMAEQRAELMALAEQAFGSPARNNRILPRNGCVAPGLGVVHFQDAARRIHLAILQPDRVYHPPRADNRLRNPANIARPVQVGNFHHRLQRNFPIGVYARSNLQITPTSVYVNCVFTPTAPTAAPTPTGVPKDPVAIGILSAILSCAFSLSLARMLGLSRIFVSVWLKSPTAFTGSIDTA